MTKKFFVLMGFAALTFIFISMPSQAQDRPIQISLVTPIQIFPEDNSIRGFRLNLIYGRNISITGLDLGLVNHTTTGTSKGVQFGFVGSVDADYVGWQGCFLSSPFLTTLFSNRLSPSPFQNYREVHINRHNHCGVSLLPF
jgi:hypothetical protein